MSEFESVDIRRVCELMQQAVSKSIPLDCIYVNPKIYDFYRKRAQCPASKVREHLLDRYVYKAQRLRISV